MLLHLAILVTAKQITRRCGTKQQSCGLPCSKQRARCDHPCPLICHEGPCPPCEYSIPRAPCRCGRHEEARPCHAAKWACTDVCDRTLACGKHRCVLTCHTGPCPPCVRAGPRTCPCGKVRVPSVACDEVILPCGGTCGRPLACGLHTCSRPCHEGACDDCMGEVTLTCPCGRTNKLGRCGTEVSCAVRCNQLRSCGRHRCRKRCCAGNTVALQADATGAQIDPTASCPPCQERCDRMLSCGNHKCQAYCHAGACPRCPLKVTVRCPCGGTTQTVPCGAERTIQPADLGCTLPCTQPAACRHRQIQSHPCHAGSCPPCELPCEQTHSRCGHACTQPCHFPSPCPPCRLSAERWCVGLHEHRAEPCSAPALFQCRVAECGNLLDCGLHTCTRACHKVEPKQETDLNGTLSALKESDEVMQEWRRANLVPCGRCEARCSRPRPPGCSHPCRASGCHGSSACPPCTVSQTVTCHCGARSQRQTCSEVMQAAVWSCGMKCHRPLPRCTHLCSDICHAGPCPAIQSGCVKSVTIRCPCGGQKELVACQEAQKLREGRPDVGVAHLTLLACDPTTPGCRTSGTSGTDTSASGTIATGPLDTSKLRKLGGASAGETDTMPRRRQAHRSTAHEAPVRLPLRRRQTGGNHAVVWQFLRGMCGAMLVCGLLGLYLWYFFLL